MIPADTFWNERTVLVTGYSGFVGSWLSRRLCESGARVIGYARNRPDVRFLSGWESSERFTTVCGDVNDCPLLERSIRDLGVDIVFHLAARSRVADALQDPRETFDANISGTWNLLEAVRCSGLPVRVVQASSDQLNSLEPAEGAGQTTRPASLSPYAASKACAELLSRSYSSSYRVKVCAARTSNLYGERDLSFQRIIPGTIRAVLAGKQPVINGSGMAKRDYLYVDDAVRGYMLLAETLDNPSIAGEAFSLNSGTQVRVLDIVDEILKLMGRSDLQPEILRRVVDESVGSSASDPTANLPSGWTPKWSLNTGLEKTIAWYRAHPELLWPRDKS